ncbi:MAG: MBL fold metallo-hydrolase, partial [Acidimicrobiia bacterium]|nr:MBL fold metallo-hydrolase [Acidimicrobiia bacterium]
EVRSVRIERVLASNPGPFTGPGTNTWVVGDESEAVVIDPGPRQRGHEEAIASVVGDRDVTAVIVTHTHLDHAPLANPLAANVDAPALGHAPGPEFDPDVRLVDGSVVEVAGGRLAVIHTPGHADDHLCFRLGRVMFTGDHIMGGSSVMVEDLAAYLRSLERLQDEELDRLYPGHGPEIEDPAGVIDWYIAHRLQREKEIFEAVGSGATTVDQIVDRVYAEVDVSLHPLAARSVTAHLVKLSDEGVLEFDRGTGRLVAG